MSNHQQDAPGVWPTGLNPGHPNRSSFELGCGHAYCLRLSHTGQPSRPSLLPGGTKKERQQQ